jgi:hypothetical protein
MSNQDDQYDFYDGEEYSEDHSELSSPSLEQSETSAKLGAIGVSVLAHVVALLLLMLLEAVS